MPTDKAETSAELAHFLARKIRDEGTQAAVARSIEVPPSQVSMWLRGRRPDERSLTRILTAYPDAPRGCVFDRVEHGRQNLQGPRVPAKRSALATFLLEKVKAEGSQRAVAKRIIVNPCVVSQWIHGKLPVQASFDKIVAAYPDAPSPEVCVFDRVQNGKNTISKRVKKYGDVFHTEEARQRAGKTIMGQRRKFRDPDGSRARHTQAVIVRPAANRIGVRPKQVILWLRGERPDVQSFGLITAAYPDAPTNISALPTFLLKKVESEGKNPFGVDASRRGRVRASQFDAKAKRWLKRRLTWRGYVEKAGYSQLLTTLAKQGKEGMTVEELAVAIGIQPTYLRAVLKGFWAPSKRRVRPERSLQLSPRLREQIIDLLAVKEVELFQSDAVPLRLAETKTWARECAKAVTTDQRGQRMTAKAILSLWLSSDLLPTSVVPVGRPKLESFEPKIMQKVLVLFKKARAVKPTGRLPNEHWRSVSTVLYGSNTAANKARKLCAARSEFQPYLKGV